LVIAYFTLVVGLVKDMWCSVNGNAGVPMDGDMNYRFYMDRVSPWKDIFCNMINEAKKEPK
jgi:hypothetical protein